MGGGGEGHRLSQTQRRTLETFKDLGRWFALSVPHTALSVNGGLDNSHGLFRACSALLELSRSHTFT